MDGAFKKAARDMSLHANKHKRLSSEGVPEPTSEPKIEVVVKRQKISDSLEAGHESTKPSTDTDKDRPKTPVPAQDSNEAADHDAADHDAADHDVHGHPARESVSTTAEIPVKKSTPGAPSHGRETRSSRRSLPATHDLCDDDDDDVEDPNPQPAHGGECKRWEKPLVYPRFGKKKAEVDAQDLERLRDNEFLNDNLIGFYIRFLEDHLDRTNKKAAKKVYFFNSYFYATLTNKRPINYESVQKWTRTVDIFSHDYVVVPINEAAHWYVAIICNLPNLKNDSEEEPGPDKVLPADEQQKPPAQAEAEIQAIPGTPEPTQEVVRGPEEGKGELKSDAEPVKEEVTRQSMAAMTLGDKEVPASADEEWPEKEENPPTSPARFSSPPKTRGAQQKGQKNTPGSKRTSPRKAKKQKKKPRDHLDPRDPQEPVIITFDSLDFPRALTTRNLRQYLAAEAKSKKGADIDTSRMAGIRARSIPFQNNSSDCGLYMLAYLEKFVQEPDMFVSKLLQGKMSVGADWPPLSSGPLRLRLRQFLDDLYDEQGQLGSEKASERPPMADKKPISFLLPEQEPNLQQNTNTNPAVADSQIKPPSPQPATQPSEPSAVPPLPSEAAKSPEVELQLSTAGPSNTPDSPARNLRHRRTNNNPGPPKAVRSAAALFGRFNQRTESGADRDIVEVPDSQEQHDPHAHPMITDLSSPTKMKNPDETDVHAPVSASKLDKREKGDVVTVEDDDSSAPAPAPAPASESDPAVVVVEHDGPRVEVQIKETPPPEVKSTKEKQ